MNASASLWTLLHIRYASEESANDSGRRYGGCPHVAFWAV
jgi:hypothetical protein